MVIVNYDTRNSYGYIQAGKCFLPSTAIMQRAFNIVDMVFMRNHHSGLALETNYQSWFQIKLHRSEPVDVCYQKYLSQSFPHLCVLSHLLLVKPAKLLNWVSMILGLGHADCQPYTNTFGTTPDHIRQIRRFSSNEGPVDDGRASQKQTTPGPENGMAGDRYGSHVVSNTVDIQ